VVKVQELQGREEVREAGNKIDRKNRKNFKSLL
jgi:hypothetical protein